MEPGIVAPAFLTNSIEIILISDHEHCHGQDNYLKQDLFPHPQTNLVNLQCCCNTQPFYFRFVKQHRFSCHRKIDVLYLSGLMNL